jgi:uncharacterized protein
VIRWHVDQWSPAYGSPFEQEDAAGPSAESSAQVDTQVEVPDEAWQAKGPPGDVRAPDVVLLVDGVRRIDATLWTDEGEGVSHPGLAASYAAGVVRCDLRSGRAELVDWQVDRGLFTTSAAASDVTAGQVRYRARQVNVSDPSKLAIAVQAPLTELEVAVSTRVRESTEDDADLLVVDGPLRKRRGLARTVGYIKTQRGSYLSAAHTAVVTGLLAGQRSPVFKVGTAWGGYSWYLRLPSGRGSGAGGNSRPGAPWAGMVRVECSTELSKQDAIHLADLSTVTLPRFASTAYKDPRAPQNLIPIAGLERRLRGLLGDPRLLHRSLTLATA